MTVCGKNPEFFLKLTHSGQTKPLALPMKSSFGLLENSQDLSKLMELHKNIWPSVRQPQSDQPPSHEHRRGHEDGDGLGDANKWAKDQVPQDSSKLTQGVTETKACSSAERNIRNKIRVNGNKGKKENFKNQKCQLIKKYIWLICLSTNVSPFLLTSWQWGKTL